MTPAPAPTNVTHDTQSNNHLRLPALGGVALLALLAPARRPVGRALPVDLPLVPTRHDVMRCPSGPALPAVWLLAASARASPFLPVGVDWSGVVRGACGQAGSVCGCVRGCDLFRLVVAVVVLDPASRQAAGSRQPANGHRHACNGGRGGVSADLLQLVGGCAIRPHQPGWQSTTRGMERPRDSSLTAFQTPKDRARSSRAGLLTNWARRRLSSCLSDERRWRNIEGGNRQPPSLAFTHIDLMPQSHASDPHTHTQATERRERASAQARVPISIRPQVQPSQPQALELARRTNGTTPTMQEEADTSTSTSTSIGAVAASATAVAPQEQQPEQPQQPAEQEAEARGRPRRTRPAHSAAAAQPAATTTTTTEASASGASASSNGRHGKKKDASEAGAGSKLESLAGLELRFVEAEGVISGRKWTCPLPPPHIEAAAVSFECVRGCVRACVTA